MPSPLFEAFHQSTPNAPPQMSGPFGNVQQLMQQFDHFRRTITGDPRQMVEQMLQSGRITQQQLDHAQRMAEPLMRLLGL